MLTSSEDQSLITYLVRTVVNDNGIWLLSLSKRPIGVQLSSNEYNMGIFNTYSHKYIYITWYA